MKGFTAAMFLALFAEQKPVEYVKNPERIAVVAVAAEQAQNELAPKWIRGNAKASLTPRLLGAAVAVAVIKESGLWETVHTGERRGPSGEICLTQIHSTNRLWQRTGAPSREALAGTDLQSTKWCLQAGVHSLLAGLNYCWHRKFWTHWAEAMWTMYHYGNRCWLSPGAHERAGYMRRLAATNWKPTSEHHALIEAVRGILKGTN